MDNGTPEQWLPIPGYEAFYEVSDHGRVRRLKKRGGSTRNWPYLVPTPQGRKRKQYLGVTLYLEGKRWDATVHVLMMLAFIGPCPKGQEIRHLNGNQFDNRLENLAYGTPQENTQDAFLHGTRSLRNPTATRNAEKTHCPQGHEYTEENTYYKIHYKTGTPCRRCWMCDRARNRAYKLRKRREKREAEVA